MNILKKYLTIMLLLGLTCPATACNQQFLLRRRSSAPSETRKPRRTRPGLLSQDRRRDTSGDLQRRRLHQVRQRRQLPDDRRYDDRGQSRSGGHQRTGRLVRFAPAGSSNVKKFAELMGRASGSYEYPRAMAYQGGAYGDGIASREKPVRCLCRSAAEGRRRRTPRDGRRGVREIRLRHHPPRPCILAGSGRDRSTRSTRSSNENSAARRNPSSSAATSTPVPIRPPSPN